MIVIVLKCLSNQVCLWGEDAMFET